MKIKHFNKSTYNLITIILWLIIFSDSRFLYLFRLPSFLGALNSATNKYLIIVFIIISCVLLLPSLKSFFNRKMILSKYLAVLTINLMILSVYSMMRYTQTIMDVFTSWHHFLLVFMVIPLLYYFQRNEGIDSFMKVCNFFSITMCLLVIVQSFIYSKTNNIFLGGLSSDMIQIRQGNLRLNLANIVNLTFIYNSAKLFNDKNEITRDKTKYIIYILIEMYAVFYVQMSRTMIIIYAGIIAIVYLSKKNNKWIRYSLVVLFGVISTQFLNLNTFFSSFSLDSTSGMAISTSNRLGALEYFKNVFLNNPILGNGFIRDSRADLQSILHGPTGTYYYSDLGIFGLAAEMGILGIIVYIFLLGYVFKTILNMTRNRKIIEDFDYSIMVGLFAFLLFSTPTVILTNPANSIMIPIIIAIYEYFKVKYSFIKLNIKSQASAKKGSFFDKKGN